jgi:hypothetical protein
LRNSPGNYEANSSAPPQSSTDQTFTDWIKYRSTHAPNGLRYPRVGGTRQRHFIGTSFEPRKLLENAQTPTRRVHAVLGALLERR